MLSAVWFQGLNARRPLRSTPDAPATPTPMPCRGLLAGPTPTGVVAQVSDFDSGRVGTINQSPQTSSGTSLRRVFANSPYPQEVGMQQVLHGDRI